MADARFITLPPDSRSEYVLWLMPNRGEPPAEVIIHAGGLEKIDAWGATALRMGIELWARRQQQQVSVSEPKDSAAWLMLYHLLAGDCPAHLILTDDSSRPSGRCPSAIHLPTARISSIRDADALSEMLLDSQTGRLTPALRFLAAQLPELAQNALQHGAKSVTDPVACCLYDRHEDELQLVVSDLGGSYAQGTDAEARLLETVRAQPDGALTAAVELATARGLDATLTLAAGTGRVYWRAGAWSSATGQAVAGFVAALCVQIP
jgi:hypothetical protein